MKMKNLKTLRQELVVRVNAWLDMVDTVGGKYIGAPEEITILVNRNTMVYKVLDYNGNILIMADRATVCDHIVENIVPAVWY